MIRTETRATSKIKFSRAVDLDNSASHKPSTPVKVKTPNNKRKAGDDIEVEENMDNDDDGFDPSLLCSVEITPQRGESDSEPETRRPKVAPPRDPLKLKLKK